jgi:uncharacterized membrane protein YccC
MAMSGTAPAFGARLSPPAAGDARRLPQAFLAAGPPLLFGLRLWLSVSLALYVAFWLELDNPYWAGASAAIMCQPQLGASLRKGWFRMVGTVTGAVVSVLLVACFANDRALFLGGLVLWGAACAFVATVLRNFASYAAALAGYTAAIIASDLLGATGGVDANAAFLLAVSRASEIIIGIACAGIVLAGTDLGGARRRLAAQLAELGRAIVAGFAGDLATGGRPFTEWQGVRRGFIGRVVALDPLIDQTIGESSQIRFYSPVLQGAVNGLFEALSGWRAVANHLLHLRSTKSPQDTAAIREYLRQALPSAEQVSVTPGWAEDPLAVRRLCEAIVRRLVGSPAGTPTLRLLADKTALAFAGIAHVLDGLVLLVADPTSSMPHGGLRRRVPDWLPACVNGGRALVVSGAAALFWIVTAWPSGGLAMTFATIVVLLLGPRADQAYGAALVFTVGAALDLLLTAIVTFAVLPALGVETFVGFSLVIGVFLVPIAALLARAPEGWQLALFTGMTMVFIPLLQPTNPITYDQSAFYNTGLAIISGCAAGAMSFRLLPPLSPAFRTRRLLALSLRDLRRLAVGHRFDDWEHRIGERLAVLPEAATPLQGAYLLGALSLGSEITRLRDNLRRLDPDLREAAEVEAAFRSIAQGKSADAMARLARLDAALAADAAGTQAVLRVRAGILAATETLNRYAEYFDSGAVA